MNPDDPKLTAFALNELDEPERTAVAEKVAASPDAKDFVDETREIAAALKRGFAEELAREGENPARRHEPSANLIDIRDDPWFWSVARPLVLAAGVTIFAIIVAVLFVRHKTASSSVARADQPIELNDVQAETVPGPRVNLPAKMTVLNPLSAETVGKAERVVVGEFSGGEEEPGKNFRVVEVIADTYRLEKLKQRLMTPVLKNEAPATATAKSYELVFIDGAGEIVACASFSCPSAGAMLHLSERAAEGRAKLFRAPKDLRLPGDWKPGVDYSQYAIPFSDWADAIGYCPGA